MKYSSSITSQDHFIPYLCKFSLYIQQLEAQLYFPSSYKISWRTKDNDQLATTSGFCLKNQLHQVKFDETLQAQTIMLYNTQTRSYIDKDTCIVVSYYLNSKQNQVKELGRIILKMTRFLEEDGDSTVRKGEPTSRLSQNGKSMTGSWQKRNSQNNNRFHEEIRCLRLEGSQYNAKLKFRCQLVQSTVSKLSLSSISSDEFNQPIQCFLTTYKKGCPQVPRAKSVVRCGEGRQLVKQERTQKIQKTQKGMIENRVVQNVSKLIGTQNQHLKQSNKTQNTKESVLVQQSLMISSSINQGQQNQQDEKVLAQLQHLQKQNLKLSTLCEHQKGVITQQEQALKKLKEDYYMLEDELKQKEVYLQNNWEKLQQLDQMKYDLIELKEYASKLEQRLTQIHNEKPETLKFLLKSITGARDSVIKSPENRNKMSNHEDSMVRLSSITLIDDSCTNNGHKKLSQSVSYMRPPNRLETKVSIPDNLYNLSSSQIQLTNSELRQIEGSTVRMQHELSFMQMELYEVKAEVNFQQDKYETECILHSQTKMELFSTQQKLSTVQKQLKQLQNQRQSMFQDFTQLQQWSESLRQDLSILKEREIQMRKQIFKLREGKKQQQYQLSVTIKQQKIQLQSLRQQLGKEKSELTSLEQLLDSAHKRLHLEGEEMLKIKNELLQSVRKNNKLKDQIETCRKKQSQISEYLSGLQNEFSEVHKIVEEKETNQEQLQQVILEKEQLLEKRQSQISQLQHMASNLQLTLQNTQKQLALQRIKSSSTSSTTEPQGNLSKSPSERERLSLMQSSNSQLLRKNKQLTAIVNKNANALIAFEKQKKELIKLKQLVAEANEVKELYQKLQQEYTKTLKQLEKLKTTIKQLQSKHLEQRTFLTEQKDNFKLLLEKEQENNLQIFERMVRQQQAISELQSRISQKQRKVNETQVRLNRLAKEKRLFEETQKLLEAKNRSYQSTIMQQQSTIQSSESLIRELQQKVKAYQSYQLGGNSFRNSSDAVNDGTSEIRLDSYIRDSRKSYNLNNNLLKNSQTIKREETDTRSLLSQIEQLKQRLQVYREYDSMEREGQKRRDSTKTDLLVRMIQSYLQMKIQAQNSPQLTQMIDRLHQIRQKGHQQHKININSKPLLDKAQYIVRELNKYKTRLLKDNRNKANSAINSIIDPLKPIESALSQLVALILNF